MSTHTTPLTDLTTDETLPSYLQPISSPQLHTSRHQESHKPPKRRRSPKKMKNSSATDSHILNSLTSNIKSNPTKGIILRSLHYYEAPIKIKAKRHKINYLRTNTRNDTQKNDTSELQRDSQSPERDESPLRAIESPTKSNYNAQRKHLHYHQSTTYSNAQKDRYKMYNKMEELGVPAAANHDSSEHSLYADTHRSQQAHAKRVKQLRMEKKHYSDVEKYFLPLIKSNRRRDISMRASSGQNETDIEWIMERRRMEEQTAGSLSTGGANHSLRELPSPRKRHFLHSSIANVYNSDAGIPDLSITHHDTGDATNLSGLLVKEYYKQEYGLENPLLNNSQNVEYSNVDVHVDTRRGSHLTTTSTLTATTVDITLPVPHSPSRSAERLKVIDMDDLLEGSNVSPLASTRPRANPWGNYSGGAVLSQTHPNDTTQYDFSYTPHTSNQLSTTIRTEPSIQPEILQPTSSSEYTSCVNWGDACLFNVCRPLYLQPSVYFRAPERITPNYLLNNQILFALNHSAFQTEASDHAAAPTEFASQHHLPNLNQYLLSVRQFYTHEPKTSPDSLPFEFQMQDIPRDVKRDVLKQYNDEKLKAEVFRRSKRYSDQCLCLYNSCILLDNIRIFDKSSPIYGQILDRSQKINDRVMECMALNHLCLNLMLQFMNTRDVSLWHDALRYGEMHLEFTDVHGQSIAHANLGLLYLLAHVHQIGEQRNEVENATSTPLNTDFDYGDALPLCLDHYTKALVMSHSAKQPRVQQCVVNNLALALFFGGYHSEALDLLQRLLIIDHSHLNKLIIYILCGHIAQQLNKPTDAYKYYQEASKEGKHVNHALVKDLTHLAQTHMTQTKSNLLYESQMRAFREMSENGGAITV